MLFLLGLARISQIIVLYLWKQQWILIKGMVCKLLLPLTKMLLLEIEWSSIVFVHLRVRLELLLTASRGRCDYDQWRLESIHPFTKAFIIHLGCRHCFCCYCFCLSSLFLKISQCALKLYLSYLSIPDTNSKTGRTPSFLTQCETMPWYLVPKRWPSRECYFSTGC